MALHMIQILAAVIVVALVVAYLYQHHQPFSFNTSSPAYGALMSSAAEVAKTIKQQALSLRLAPANPEPDALIVREWNDGRATLLVRERSCRKVATGQLIIWSSKKKKRIQDSYYDLGAVRADSFGDQVVDEFLSMAQQKLHELAANGAKRKRGAKALASASAPVQAAPAASPPENAEPAVKAKRFPSVHRGSVVEMGIMPRVITEGAESKDIECYGVKLRTPEGIIDPVWGTHLRTMMREARAGVGDSVEIVKVGRKTVDEGKAPMNLYQVTKLA